MTKKQIPFRYPEELEKDFDELFKMQYCTKNKNKAMIDAIEICAELSRVIEKFKGESKYFNSNTKDKIYELIKQLKKISKKRVTKNDIKNLDLNQ